MVDSGAPAPDPYTDPNELFDVCDATGTPTGQVKPRWQVHRDGDWHRAFHCWVLCEIAEGPALLLQRRGLYKDTWPNRLDVSVGGHYKAGETLADVVREVEEEIGLPVTLDQLRPLGRRVVAGEGEAGIKDREVQEVFLWQSGRRLEAFHPQPVEVSALEAPPLPSLLELLAGRRDEAAAHVLRPGGRMTHGTIRVDDFIPTIDQYFYRIAALADLALRGSPRLVL